MQVIPMYKKDELLSMNLGPWFMEFANSILKMQRRVPVNM
jgi:hypothetical protein